MPVRDEPEADFYLLVAIATDDRRPHTTPTASLRPRVSNAYRCAAAIGLAFAVNRF